jgi:magnesium chelatase family protein
MLVATQNPCPCGYFGDEKRACACSQQQILNYQQKLSGPLLDRIDMVVPVARVERDKLFSSETKEKPRATEWRKQIAAARDMQMKRQKKPNSSLSTKQLEKFAELDQAAKNILSTAADKLNLSARSYFKVLRVAKTIADLAVRENIAKEDAAEALQYR